MLPSQASYFADECTIYKVAAAAAAAVAAVDAADAAGPQWGPAEGPGWGCP